ncbi:hypothetical protein [Winogradskyella sp. PE311]|uniref:hypothetical protein n=1 Tax=Winogradskyella sp. PE311 TaxID=3366943 RepID=UPI00398172FD
MKKLLASIIFLLLVTAVSFAQTKDTCNSSVKNENIKKEVSTAYTFRAEAIKLNRKKI